MDILKTLKKPQLVSILQLHPQFKKIPKQWTKQKIIDKMIEYDVHYKVPLLDKYECYSIAFLRNKCLQIDPQCKYKTKKKLIEFLESKEKEKENDIMDKLYQCVTETKEIDISMKDMMQILI